MSSTAAPLQGNARNLRKAFVASLSGTSLEWYDFALFGAVTGTVFSKLFFAGDDPAIDTVKAFMTYGAGYIARPIGGVFFGRLGDVIGRKKVLVWTLTLIGVATFAIGLLPTYGSAGIWAPILLVTMRFLQGVGVGGEWGGAVLLSSEFATPETRGFWASAAQVGVPIGSVLANLVLLGMTWTLSDAAFMSWGWRVAFMVSIVLVGFGLYIRQRLEETPVFKRILEQNAAPEAPVKEVMQTQGRALIGAILTRFGPDVQYAFFAVFVITFLQTGDDALTFNQALTCTMTAGALQILTMPFMGWLSDRVNRRLVYAIGAIGGGLWTFVFMWMLSGGKSFGLAFFGVIVGLFFHSIMYGPQAAHIAEQFHARLRYTGSSLAYTFAGIFAGGLAPTMFALLMPDSPQGWTIAAYVMGAIVITLIGLALGKVVVDDIDKDESATAASA